MGCAESKITAAVLLIAASLTIAASTVGVAAPAHAYAGVCYSAARLYRTDFNYEPPPVCWGSVWFRSTDGQHWDRPLPPDQDQGTRPPPPASLWLRCSSPHHWLPPQLRTLRVVTRIRHRVPALCPLRMKCSPSWIG
jgi:hypothetical protein